MRHQAITTFISFISLLFPFIVSAQTSGSHNGHDYVDLGLPSGVKWATCNIGASSPSSAGSYFAWGETGTKSEYRPDNSFTNEKNISDFSGNSTYDAARSNWGGKWRTPSKTDCEELINNCTWSWATLNGVKGYKVTGPNGNSIFLPLTGYHSVNFINDHNSGYYMTSTPTAAGNGHYKGAYQLKFYSVNRFLTGKIRSNGYAVRPVMN